MNKATEKAMLACWKEMGAFFKLLREEKVEQKKQAEKDKKRRLAAHKRWKAKCARARAKGRKGPRKPAIGGLGDWVIPGEF